LRLTTHLYIMSSLSTRRIIIPFFHISSWPANGRLCLYLYHRNTIPNSEASFLTVFHCLLKITLWKWIFPRMKFVNFFFLPPVYQFSAHACHARPSLVHATPTPRGVYTVPVYVKKFGELSCSRKIMWLKWARSNYSSPYDTWAKWM